jgi:hypothetical protein
VGAAAVDRAGVDGFGLAFALAALVASDRGDLVAAMLAGLWGFLSDRYLPAVIFNKYPTHNYTVFATTVTPLLSHLCDPPATVVLLNVRVKGQTTSPIGMLVVASGIRLWNIGLDRAADVSQLSEVVGLPTQRN